MTGRRPARQIALRKLVLTPAMAYPALSLLLALGWLWLRLEHRPDRAQADTAQTPPTRVRAGAGATIALEVVTVAGQAGMGEAADGSGPSARFRLPNGLALDPEGNLYVADTANNAIRKMDRSGRVSTLAGMPHSHGTNDGVMPGVRFWGPFGLAANSSGELYVTDTGNNTIREIDRAGVVTTVAGAAGQPGEADGAWRTARFRNPWGVAAGPQGELYVADGSNDTIRKLNPLGLVHTLAGQPGKIGSRDGFGDNARFDNPSAVALDAAGNLYVADSGNDVIRKITPSRVVSTLAGLAGHAGGVDGLGSAARFWNPQGLTLDSAGNIYVADTGNDVIRKITPEGRVSTLAGLLGVSGSADGPAGQARFNNPAGIVVDQAGQIYVADTNNHTLRKIRTAAAKAD